MSEETILAPVDMVFNETGMDKRFDIVMVDYCAQAMKEKLAKKRSEGRGGWHHPNECSNAFLLNLLKEHINKGDMVDVMNFAAMIYCRSEMFGEDTV